MYCVEPSFQWLEIDLKKNNKVGLPKIGKLLKGKRMKRLLRSGGQQTRKKKNKKNTWGHEKAPTREKIICKRYSNECQRNKHDEKRNGKAI